MSDSRQSVISIIGATQKRHGLILPTSSGLIVRKLLRLWLPFKAEAHSSANLHQERRSRRDRLGGGDALGLAKRRAVVH
jgi:hypothetical protein